MLTLEGLELLQGDFRLSADWTAEPGARVAIIGPSGSGKSTLLLAIAGFLAPSRGRILWKDQDLAPFAPGARPLSILFQDQNLFPHLTLAQNIGLGLSPRLDLTAAQHRSVASSLERVGLGGMGQRKPSQVSGGQAGRAALARVLLRARPILLLDEPFAALGPGLKAEMLDLVAEVANETSALVLMVTHDPNDARMFAPLTSIVDEGRALAPRPTEDLFTNPTASLRRYLGPS
jgi:thiamine transport system ATP-binding protein